MIFSFNLSRVNEKTNEIYDRMTDNSFYRPTIFIKKE